ncbi:MAG: hypothetical protein ACT4OE_11705 [Sphingosinicella sp.]
MFAPAGAAPGRGGPPFLAKGRRRRKGERYANGRLKPARDPGNVRVRAHRAFWQAHGAVTPGDDLDCALGLAHAAGLLEGMRVEGRVLLAHGREWHRLYRGVFGGAVKTRALEPLDRSPPSLETTPLDRRFCAWARIVAGLSLPERRVLQLVAIDHGDGWALPPFLARLVEDYKKRRGLAHAGRPPTAADRRKLAALKAALLALAEGGRRGGTGRAA